MNQENLVFNINQEEEKEKEEDEEEEKEEEEEEEKEDDDEEEEEEVGGLLESEYWNTEVSEKHTQLVCVSGCNGILLMKYLN